jgi:D-arabinose 1-dehydrogenase-like Zn-dependent alcohol dehydrogenase
MLSARYVGAGKPLVIENVEIPKVNGDEVLIELKAAGICGSDVHYVKGDAHPSKVPITLGHEGAGIIKEVGNKVHNLTVGDHVIVHYVISCGSCKNCILGYDNRCRNRISIGHDVDGTFAEYLKVPEKNAVKIAKHVPFEWGAITSCAVSTAYHAVKISNMSPGDTVVIFGAGGVGLHAVMWAKFFGAGLVIAVDIVDSKLNVAKEYGADLTINSTRENVLEVVNRETDGWGADVAIECSGSSKAMEDAIKVIKGKNYFETGTVVSVGFQKEPFKASFLGLREGAIKVSGDHTLFELYQIIKLLERKRIDLSKSITHTIKLSEVNEAISLIEKRDKHVERIVINNFKE